MLYWLKLKRIRIREQNKLDAGNLKMFKKIIEYIKNSNLQYLEREEALQQIIDILLQSQAEHKSAYSVIGDYELFCKSIIEEYTKDKSTIYTVLHHIQRAIMNTLVVLVLDVIFFKVLYPKLNVDISAKVLIFAMGISFILMPFSHITKQKKWASVIYFVATMGAILFVTLTKWGETIDNAIINNTDAILLGMALIVLVIEIYKRVCDRKCTGGNNL